MKWFLRIFFVVAILSSSCGSDNSAHLSGATVTLSASAGAGWVVVDDNGVKLNISTGTSASGIEPPSYLIETAESGCSFSLPNSLTSQKTNGGTGEITVVEVVDVLDTAAAQALCVVAGGVPDDCIWCQMDDGATCTISCYGTIASNAANAGDYFEIWVVATHAFTTEFGGDGYGMVRVDGYTNDQTISSLDNSMITQTGQQFIQTGCNNPAVIQVEAESSITSATPSGDSYDADFSDGHWHEFFEILESAASVGDPKACTISDRVVLRATLPNPIVHNQNIDMAFSQNKPIKLGASLCASQTICDKHTF